MIKMRLIKKYMEKFRYKQGTLAHELGISRVSLNKRLTGKIPFTAQEIAILANIFGCDVGELLTKEQ